MTDHVQAYLSLRRAFGFHLPVSYLSQEEVTAVLDAPDRSSWSGHRDAVMLATMYNTGARVSEIIRLNVEDLQLRPTATVRIHGKECHSYCISFRRRNETVESRMGASADAEAPPRFPSPLIKPDVPN
jgi:site-specific recombinase XerD